MIYFIGKILIVVALFILSGVVFFLLKDSIANNKTNEKTKNDDLDF